MSAEAVGWVFRYSPYKGASLVLHLALADSANDVHGYELWARQEWLADKARISRQTVNAILARMVEDGQLDLVEDNSPIRKPNRYRLVMPDGPSVFDARRMSTEATRRGRAARTSDMSTETTCPNDMSTEATCSCQQGRHEHVARGDTEPKGNPSTSQPQTARAADPLSSEISEPPVSPRECNQGDDGPADSTSARSSDEAERGAQPAVTGPKPATKPKPAKVWSPEVHQVADRLQEAIAAHTGRQVRKDSWMAEIDRLLRKGPADLVKPEPVPVDEVLAVIDYVFGPGSAPGSDGFCWADNVQSGAKLRKHWIRLQRRTRSHRTTGGGRSRTAEDALAVNRRAREKALRRLSETCPQLDAIDVQARLFVPSTHTPEGGTP